YSKDVVLDFVSFETREEVVFDFFMIRAADGARAEGNDLLHILHGAAGVDGGSGSVVGRERKRWRLQVLGSGWTWALGRDFRNVLPVVARHEARHARDCKRQQHPRKHPRIEIHLRPPTFLALCAAWDGRNKRSRC